MANSNGPSLHDNKLIKFRPIVCLELFDKGKLQTLLQQPRIRKSDITGFYIKPVTSLYCHASSKPQSNFRYSPHHRRSMGRTIRAAEPDDEQSNVLAAQKNSKKVMEPLKNRSLRVSNVVNVEATIKRNVTPSPSPPETPSYRTRSLTRKATVGTRRLLPTATAPKTCPRILRNTPQRSGVAKYQDSENMDYSSSSDESTASSASSAMCSPRKKTATTPAKGKKINAENINPAASPARSGSKTPNKLIHLVDDIKPPVSVPRLRGRPSLKATTNETIASPSVRPANKPSGSSRRRGKPLLKTGAVAKALKQDANSSPSSWASSVDGDSDGFNDGSDSTLNRALSRLHLSKEEFSRQQTSTKKGQNWAPLGREKEATEIFNFISDHLNAGTSGSLFVAGVPGIGKSATIGAVLERLNSLAYEGQKGDLPRFRLVTVNGFHFASPVRFYCEVHRQLLRQIPSRSTTTKGALRGTSSQQKLKRVPGPKVALDSLNSYFTGKSSLGVLPTVLVVDELDALVSATSANQVAFAGSQGTNARRTTNFGANRVLYNLLEWASTPVSRLVIVAVANTLDLPERALPLRVVSRLGLHRLAFMPYTHLQLESIVRARLATLPSPVFDSPDAILLAARKVAMASGDARRVLELCRLAVERAMRSSRSVATMQDVVAASESLSSATSRLALVRQVAVSWRRVLTALVNVCRMQCREHGACLIRELHSELMDMWREEGGFCRPSDVEVVRIVGQLVACGLLAAEDISQLGLQAHVQLTMPLPDLANLLASLLGANASSTGK